MPAFLSVIRPPFRHTLTGAKQRQMDSKTEGLDSLAQAPLLPYTFWEGPGLVRPRGQGCRKGAPSEEGAQPGWEEGPPGQSLKGVVSVFEHENGVIDLQGWAQLDTHDLHNVRLCQQKEGLAVNHLRGREREEEERVGRGERWVWGGEKGHVAGGKGQRGRGKEKGQGREKGEKEDSHGDGEGKQDSLAPVSDTEFLFLLTALCQHLYWKIFSEALIDSSFEKPAAAVQLWGFVLSKNVELPVWKLLGT